MKQPNRESLKKHYEERICKECKGFFYVAKEGRVVHKRPGNIRPRSAVTCRRKCGKKNRRNNYVPPERRNPLLDN